MNSYTVYYMNKFDVYTSEKPTENLDEAFKIAETRKASSPFVFILDTTTLTIAKMWRYGSEGDVIG